jgi:FimV-like protein
MGRMVSPDNALFADAGGGIKRMEFDLPELSTPVAAEAMIDSEPELHERLFEPEHPTPPPPMPDPQPTDASGSATGYEAIPFERVETATPAPDPWADDSATVAMPAPASERHEPEPPAPAAEPPSDAEVEAVGGSESHAEPAVTAPVPSSPAPSTPSRPASAVEDPVDTKLDLALAYLEMGDPEAARQMLDEVMDEGDSRQKAEALKLRAQAGGGQRQA